MSSGSLLDHHSSKRPQKTELIQTLKGYPLSSSFFWVLLLLQPLTETSSKSQTNHYNLAGKDQMQKPYCPSLIISCTKHSHYILLSFHCKRNRKRGHPYSTEQSRVSYATIRCFPNLADKILRSLTILSQFPLSHQMSLHCCIKLIQ